MDYIHMYIMDLLLGDEPWLNSSDICDRIQNKASYDLDISEEEEHCQVCRYQAGALDAVKQEMRMRNMASQTDDRRMHAEEDFVGAYGHYAYGNVTIGMDDITRQLYLVYGLEGK